MSRPDRIEIAAVQPRLGWLMPERNLEHLGQVVAGLAADGRPDLVVLPEAFAAHPPERDGDRWGPAAMAWLAETAARSGVALVGGTVERRDADGRITNVCPVFDRGGALVGEYAKRTLFSKESASRSAGESDGVFEVAGVRVGVLVCADMWHPELARQLIDRVDVLAVPAKTTVRSADAVTYARALWRSMAVTRAMENGFAVVVSDWAAGSQDGRTHEASEPRSCDVKTGDAGVTASGMFTGGATTIVDPGGRPILGRVLHELSDGAPGVLRASINLNALDEYRSYRRSVGLLP